MRFMSQECADNIFNLKLSLNQAINDDQSLYQPLQLYKCAFAVKVMITNFQSQAKIQAKSSGLHADQIVFLELITEIKEQMKNCEIKPHKTSLWGAAINDRDGFRVFEEGQLTKETT